jgi:mannose-6-phosphate isomerase-like protein (cupin superfamily)
MYKYFELETIQTKGKPGTLININIEEISKKLNIIFNPNKMFYLNDLNSAESRGNHANVNASEILICLCGSFEIKLFDGKKTETYLLEKNSGIYIPKNTWLDINNFKEGVILVYVDVDCKINKESIYDIAEFKKYLKNI